MRRCGSGWTARCPSHEDRHASLSVAEGNDGRALLKCFAGCTAEAIVAAIGLELSDLFPAGGGGSYPRRETSTPQHSAGCTLASYAEAKRLPIDFLRELGLSDFTYLGSSAVRVPYFNAGGEEAAVRYRLALVKGDGEDGRFRWQKGSKSLLYGLNRIAHAHKAGYAILAEGESDCHVLWHAGYPALGVPGANNWSEERDADHLDGLTVYVVIEPDVGGESVMRWIGGSRIRDRVRLVSLGKDVGDLYLDDPGRFAGRLEAALQAATPWAEHAKVEAELERARSWSGCQELARSPRILDRLGC